MGRGPSYDRTVVVPSGAYMEQTTGTGVRRTAGFGFKGTPFLEPRDVSFAAIQVREGQTTGSATGFLMDDNGKNHSHPLPGRSCRATQRRAVR